MVRRILRHPAIRFPPDTRRSGPGRTAWPVGWWRMPVSRDYYFTRMRNGDLLWIYYDRARRRWRCQGRVE